MTDFEKLEIQVPIPQRMVTHENRERLAAVAAAAAAKAIADALATFRRGDPVTDLFPAEDEQPGTVTPREDIA